MSTFHISDLTCAGAFLSAAKAAEDSDRRNAARYSETGKGPNVLKSLKNLVGRIAIAIIEKRPAASQLTTGPF